MDDVIYREFHNLRRLAWALAVLGFILLVIGFVIDPSFSGLLVVAAIFLVFPILFLASIYRMNRIVLTPTSLDIGSESFRPADFDFTFGVQPPLVLSHEEQAEIESRWPLPADSELRIAGGSWGRRVGTAMIVLQETDHAGVVALFTRHPAVLDPLLTEWIETVPESRVDGPDLL